MKKKYVTIIILILIIVFKINKNYFKQKEVIYNGNNLLVSIDGHSSNTLPISGNYYLVDYECKSRDTKISWDRENHKLNVRNQNKKAGVSCYLDFQSTPKLSDMEVGSYVAYVGSGGTVGNTAVACQTNGPASSSTATAETEAPNSCSGQNARQDLDTSNYTYGYCYNADYKYHTTGWRIAYIDNTTTSNLKAVIVSAGSPECNAREESMGNVTYIMQSNAKALKYCNTEFVDGNCTCTDSNADGLCDSASTDAWAINDNDFYNITKSINGYGKRLTVSSSSLGDSGGTLGTKLYCNVQHSYQECGYNNDLLDNGGYYWFAAQYSSSEMYGLYWRPIARHLNHYSYTYAFGLRPVISLSSSVYVTGGSGTMDDPYQIGNNTFIVNDGNNYISADVKDAVELNLISSNAATMCISVDSSGCSNYINFNDSYTLDLSDEEDGEKIIYVYYKDSLGGLVASLTQKITIDSEAPTGSRLTINDGTGLTRVLTTFSMGADTMCLSNTSSNVGDCTDWVPYATSYTWRLSEGTGNKTVYAFYKDKAGNVSSISDTTTVSSIVEFSVNEAFADTTYDTTIKVTGGTTYPWTVSSGQFRSANTGVNSSTSSSTIQFTPTTNAMLSFDYGISSEATYDKLTIKLVGSNDTSVMIADAISGTIDESVSNIRLLSGVTYTLELSYTKDKSGSSGNDRAYIDNLTITS